MLLASMGLAHARPNQKMNELLDIQVNPQKETLK